MSGLHKKVRIGKYAVPVLLLATLAIGTVSAVAYVVLTWTQTATVVSNPKVSFFTWVGGAKANILSYSVNIFPSIKTVDENLTSGIENWDTVAHRTGLRVTSIGNQAQNVASFLVKVSNATTVWSIATVDPVNYAYTMLTPGKYTIWIEITGAAGAVPASTSAFIIDMKVENP
jgi:hypothetical protein